MKAEIRELYIAIKRKESEEIVCSKVRSLIQNHPTTNEPSFLRFCKENDLISFLLRRNYESVAIDCFLKLQKLFPQDYEISQGDFLDKTVLVALLDKPEIQYLEHVFPYLNHPYLIGWHFGRMLEEENWAGIQFMIDRHKIIITVEKNHTRIITPTIKKISFFNQLCEKGLIKDPFAFIRDSIKNLDENFLIELIPQNEEVRNYLLTGAVEIDVKQNEINLLPSYESKIPVATGSFLQFFIAKNYFKLVNRLTAYPLKLEKEIFLNDGTTIPSLTLIHSQEMLSVLIDRGIIVLDELKAVHSAFIIKALEGSYFVWLFITQMNKRGPLDDPYIKKFNVVYKIVLPFIDTLIKKIHESGFEIDEVVTKFRPKVSMLDLIIPLAINLSCLNVAAFIFTKLQAQLTQDDILIGLKSSLKNKNRDMLEIILGNSAITPAAMTKFLEYSIKSRRLAFIEITLKHPSVNLTDSSLKDAVIKQYDPKVAELFLSKGMTLSDEQLVKFIKLAAIKGDEETLNKLKTRLKRAENLGGLFIYSKQRKEEIVSAEHEARFRNYYTGVPFTQIEYRAETDHLTDIILHGLCNNLLDLSHTLNSESIIPNFLPKGNFSSSSLIMFKNPQPITPEVTPLQKITWHEIGLIRTTLAELSDTNNAADFGKIRVKPLGTPTWSANYGPYYEKLKEDSFHEKYSQSDCFQNTEYYFYQGRLFASGTVVGFIKGSPINLTACSKTLPGLLRSEDNPGWVHTDASVVPTIVNHINELIENIKTFNSQEPDSIPDLTKLIAHIHWWMAHACIFQRGSASITDCLIKALFKYHKLDATWEGMPDCIALTTPDENEFCDNYAANLNLKLTPINVIPLEVVNSASLKLAI